MKRLATDGNIGLFDNGSSVRDETDKHLHAPFKSAAAFVMKNEWQISALS